MTAPTLTECPGCHHLPHAGRCPGYANCGCGPTITDTPESAIADGRCSFDQNGGDTLGQYLDYRACGHTVVATWYAVKWPSRTRTAISALCAIHDRHAQRAAADASATIGGRMYQREAIA